MKILLVGNGSYREKVIYKIVKHNVACKQNIIECLDTESGINLVQNKVIKDQTSLDLIIADDKILGNKFQKNLCDWVRTSDQSFSNNDFKISSLPIILLKDEIGYGYNLNNLYNSVIPFTDSDADLRIINACDKTVKEWREKIPADLDLLEINMNDLKVYNHDYNLSFPNYS
jgi:hypothetical protein